MLVGPRCVGNNVQAGTTSRIEPRVRSLVVLHSEAFVVSVSHERSQNVLESVGTAPCGCFRRRNVSRIHRFTVAAIALESRVNDDACFGEKKADVT